jgi:hypothetical protein
VDDGGARLPAGSTTGPREASKLGAAARSDRAEAGRAGRVALAVSSVGVDEPPLTLGAGSLVESASLMGAAATSPSLAQQVAVAAGMRVVERFEVMA